jgi:SAM-dependent methyltransferase
MEAAVMRSLFSGWRRWWDAVHDEHSDHLDRLPANWTRTAIFLASALTLYVEMVMVRWHGTCFHAFAIFKNVSLLSCFLGLGIGYGLSGRKRITLASFLPLLALQALLFGLLSTTNLGGRRFNPVAEQLVMGTAGSKWSWLDAVEGNAFLAVVFVLNALMFIPLGHLAGRLMGRLPRVQSYSLNLLGSLAGIAAFFLLSLAWTGPTVWMGVAALALAPFLIGHPRSVAVSVGSLAVILIALGLMNSRREQMYFSPYQVIALRLPDPRGATPTMTVRVNHCFYQDIFDCSPWATALNQKNARAAEYYNLPYRLRARPGDVCVVGAGTGNDVAAALRAGARSVTAVEIDPAILYLGKHLHPERVYQDPRTRPVLNDARTFLRQTDERFDTVIYGLLDSHTNLGAMTNVRLDSFVYTVEGFRDAVRRLRPDGVLVVSYLVLDSSQGDKLFAMLKEAFPDRTPRAFQNTTYGGTTFVTGPGLDRLAANVTGAREVTAGFVQTSRGVAVATDDWPFFYMKNRTYPVSYLVMIGILLCLSGVLVKRQLGSPQVLNAQGGTFFFLGAGFMLIETKGITELGLVFGNTWSVIAVAVSGILLMVFLANQWVLRRGPVSQGRSFLLLGGALVLGLALTRLSMAGVEVPWPKLVMPLVLTLPLFFAGLIFSSELQKRGEIGDALSANLFGAMLGGFLEYNSMYLGYSSLYPLGMGLYALAYLCQVRAGRKQPAATGQPAPAGTEAPAGSQAA